MSGPSLTHIAHGAEDVNGSIMSNEDTTPDRPLLLQGKKVGLAVMRKANVPAFARWNQDLEFTALIGSPGDVHTIEMREEFYEKHSKIKSDSVEFAVILLSTGRLIGFGGLFDMNRSMLGTMFVGIGEPELQGKGHGTEASRLICEYGFFFRNLYGIKVEVNGYNRRAIRVYQRLGFKLVGRLRGAVMLNGKRYDQVIMDLLRDEFKLEHVAPFKTLERAPEDLM